MQLHNNISRGRPLLTAVLMVLLCLTVFLSRTDAADHVVTKQSDKAVVEQDNIQDAEGLDQVDAEDVSPAIGGGFEIRSARFLPWGTMLFSDLGGGIDGGGSTHFDTIPSFDNVPYVIQKDFPDEIQLTWAVMGIPSADGWPLIVEGNMHQPGGGGPGPGAMPVGHWGAVVRTGHMGGPRIVCVEFSGDKEFAVRRDDDSDDFDTPQWNEPVLPPAFCPTDDRSFPICFRRDSKMKVTTTISFESDIAPSTVKIRGDGPAGADIPETTATVVHVVDDIYAATITDIEANDEFIDEIDDTPLTIAWSVNIDSAGWTDAGSTTNPCYLVWDDPLVAKLTWTLLGVSCRGADGVGGTDPVPVLDGIWGKIKTCNLKRSSDGFPLTYYGFSDGNDNGIWDGSPPDTDRNDPGVCTFVEYWELIKEGNGQCGSWANFMGGTLKAHGINTFAGTAIKRVALRVKTADAFAVKNWATNGAAPWEIVSFDAGVDGGAPVAPAAGEAADAVGAVGQGNSPNPPSHFVNHWIVQANGKYYDPSYCLGPFTDLRDYEGAGMDGEIRRIGASFFLLELPPDDGDPTDHTDEINSYTEFGFGF